MSIWKKAIIFASFILLSVLGIKPSTATPAATENLLAQNCAKPDAYARVTTKQGTPVNVRSAPNGRIIGKIPNGWAVVTLRRDATGKWVRVTSHFGDPDYARNRLLFGSAEEFRGGWVSAAFLKPIGKFCEKPLAMLRLNLNASDPNHQMLVNEDWVERGDRIAQAVVRSRDE